MTEGIHQLPGTRAFAVKAEADAVLVDEQGAVIEVPEEPARQSGEGFSGESVAVVAPKDVTLVADADDDYPHRSLDAIYEIDPKLGLALIKIDKKIKKRHERTKGVLHPDDLDQALRHGDPQVKAAIRELRDIQSKLERGPVYKSIKLSPVAERMPEVSAQRLQQALEAQERAARDPSFDLMNLENLRLAYPELAATLSPLAPSQSIKKGYSDAYKLSKLPPGQKGGFSRVNAILRDLDRGKAWQQLDRQAGDKNWHLVVLGGGVFPLIGGVALGAAAVVSTGLAAGMMILGTVGLIAGMGMNMHDSSGKAARRFGRLLRPLFYRKRTRRLVNHAPEVVLEEGLKGLKASHSSKPEERLLLSAAASSNAEATEKDS